MDKNPGKGRPRNTPPQSALKRLLARLIMNRDAGLMHSLGTSEAYEAHKRIILSKPFLKGIYGFYFEEMLKDIGELKGKKIVEVGAGAYNISEACPEAITSNSAFNRFVDMVFDGERMPFGNLSLDAVVMLNTLHHVPRPRLLFDEAARVLKPGGVLSMVEPYFSPFGRVIYTKLHHEPVFDTPPSWEMPPGESANQIAPYHIFVRDRDLFERDYPGLKVERVTVHTAVTHLLSGGLTYRGLVPGFLAPLVWALERALKPLRLKLGMCMTVVLRKAG